MKKLLARLQKVGQEPVVRVFVGVAVMLAGALMMPVSPASADSVDATIKLIVPKGATISLRVAPTSTKYCKVSGTILKGVKPGSCKVTVTVKPKTGKSASKTVALVVTK